jgi:hypothetical protein
MSGVALTLYSGFVREVLTRSVFKVELRLSEIKGADQFSNNSEIRLDVIRCNKNNIYSDTIFIVHT